MAELFGIRETKTEIAALAEAKSEISMPVETLVWSEIYSRKKARKVGLVENCSWKREEGGRRVQIKIKTFLEKHCSFKPKFVQQTKDRVI